MTENKKQESKLNRASSNGGASASSKLSRRRLLKSAVAATLGGPMIWIPNKTYAQQCEGRGGVKHVVYIRLSGGFRFTAAFNGDVANEFNPFGMARNTRSGTEWGASRLLESATWLEGDEGQALADLGMRRVTGFTDQMAVLATVDHEPDAGNADGNHGTGLERFNTGYTAGENSIFTMLHYGLRERIEAAAAEGNIELPPFVLGSAGMARGGGQYAAYRPPLLQGDSFDNFVFASATLPDWANQMAADADVNLANRSMVPTRSMVEAYMGTRESTRKFSEIFSSDILKIRNNSNDQVDGISNAQLAQMFGDSGSARQLRLALRLFHFGCPAVYLDQGGYDMHSGEDERLEGEMDNLNRLLSALQAALHAMQHPDGDTYWDHTLVVLGSEFGRTARGNGFNSAGGSDHGGDLATRWMSMPMMGGLVTSTGIGGRQFGVTAKNDLKDDGMVFSYRSVMKTLMDLLCADHSEFFPEDAPITEIF
jgi:uncharacterized protein (DUF1501 family)